MTLKVVLVAALTPQRVIGLRGDMPWPKLPKDMAQFKNFTMGHPVIMGRKTWDSIPLEYRPLEGRTNIVLTRDRNYCSEGAVVCTTLEAARQVAEEICGGGDTIMVIGGGEIYNLAFPYATHLRLTLLEQEFDGDTFFPEYESTFTQTNIEDPITQKGVTFRFADFVR
jgi:dihydrofolate reductase